MPWAFDRVSLKRSLLLWLSRRAECRLERLRELRKADMAELDRQRDTPAKMALARAKLDVYYDHHEDLVMDWILILDRLIADDAAGRIRSMTR